MHTELRHERRILYIEDNTPNRELVLRIFERFPQIRVITAACGEEGIEMARIHRPDLIILDIHLPDMDGYDVLRRLQNDETTRPIDVVALTANAMPDEVRRGLEAGFRDYLTKPLNIRRFIEEVEDILGLGGQ